MSILLGDYIKTGVGGIYDTQFFIDMNIVGGHIVEWIAYVYSAKTPPLDPSVNYLISDFANDEPPKRTDAMAYYICLGIATSLQAQWAAVVSYLLTPPGTLPYPYVAGTCKPLILASMDTGQNACGLVGSAPSISTIPQLVADLIDQFIALKFVSPV